MLSPFSSPLHNRLFSHKGMLHSFVSVRQRMSEQTVDQRELTMSVLMTPDMANFSGNVHGGVLLKLLDEVAYPSAGRYAVCYGLTQSVDQVLVKQAMHAVKGVT